MSKKVDERVVEMRFDNKDFESNVKTTMSTLDKLKAKLNLPSSSKALNGVGDAAKMASSNLTGLGSAVDTVNAKFSSLQVIGMTALSNITTSVMRATSNFAKKFTLEPITSGFQEYETQLNAVQTILSNTKSKGTTISDVTAALDELNEYADLTIYNFTEMTRNIGTFTAAGVGLKESVSAIKGIANLAAASGSSSQQASTAMYQLSQALAAGRVTLMDWNSVVNAGMGGELFQNALIRTARNLGTGVDAALEKYGTFRESLTKGEWLTTDVLTETLSQIAGAYDEAALRSKGYSEEEIAQILDLAQTATSAATEIKTFTQMMDTVMEAFGSGWAKTWQLVFGDFEEAKAFWTKIFNETISPVIENMSNARNALIQDAMGGGGSEAWTEFKSRIESAGVSIDTFQEKLTEVVNESGGSMEGLLEKYEDFAGVMRSGEISAGTIAEALRRVADSADASALSQDDLNEKLNYFQDVVNRVWRGDFKNAPERYQLLAEAGYDYAKVQQLVNKTVDGHRLTLEDLSDVELLAIGYTQEQVDQIHALAAEAEAAGQPLNDLINQMTLKSGRELFLESLTNLIQAFLKILETVGGAFSDVFSIDASGIRKIIGAFNKFTKSLILSGDDAEKVKKILKGLFSIIHLVATAAGKTLTIAFRGLNTILQLFGTDVLTVAADIGEAIYQFDRWVTSGTMIEDALNAMIDLVKGLPGPLGEFWNAMFPEGIVIDENSPLFVIVSAFEQIKAYVESFKGLSVQEVCTKLWNDIQGLFNKIRNLDWMAILGKVQDFASNLGVKFDGLLNFLQKVGTYLFEGLQNGMEDGVQGIFDFILEVANNIIETIKDRLGIHSPSTVFFEIGKNIVEGLCNGILYLSGMIRDTIYTIVEDIKSALSGVDWSAVFVVGSAVGSFIVLYQLTDALQTFATSVKSFSAPFQSAANVMNTVDTFLKKLTGANTSSKGFKNFADGVKSLAEAIAILVGALGALTLLDQSKILGALGAMLAIATILGVLTAVLSQFASAGTVIQSLELNSTLISLGVTFVLLAAAAKILETIDESKIGQVGGFLAAFWGIIESILAIGALAPQISVVGPTLLQIGVAFVLLGASAKLMGSLSAEQMWNAQAMLIAFTAVISALMGIAYFAGSTLSAATTNIDKVGIAFIMLGVASRLMGGMSAQEIWNAQSMLIAFVAVIGALMGIAHFAGGALGKATSSLDKIGIAFLMLSVSMKLLGSLNLSDIENAGVAMALIVGLIASLMAITNLFGGGDEAKITTSLLAVSISVGILAGVAVALSYVDTGALIKGIIAVGALSLIVSGMAKASRGVGDAKGTMVGLAIIIGVLAASLVALSFIEPEKLMSSVVALGSVMGVLAFVLKSASGVQTDAKAIISIAVTIALLTASLAILSQFPWENVLASAVSLGIVMGALAGSMKLISTIDDISMKAVGVMAILALVMAGLAGVLYLISGINPVGALANATALSEMIIVLTGITVVLSKANVDIAAALKGAVALAGVVAVISIVIAAIVGIAGLIGQIKGSLEFIQTAGDILQAVGEAIGGFVGGIVGGFGEAVTDALPKIAENLSEFATNLSPFLSAMTGIDPSAGQALESLGAGLLSLTQAGLLDQLTQFFGGKSNLEAVYTQLPLLGAALSGFYASTALINGDKCAVAAQALKTVIEAMATVPNSGGLLGDILGGKDYTGFANGLSNIGSALQSFDAATADITVETIQPKADALSTVIKTLSEIPNTGGLLGDILGGKDYTGFANGMTSIADGLQTFANTTNSIENLENMTPVCEALRTVIGVLSEIPVSGGWLDMIFGGHEYEQFGSGLESIATSFVTYANTVSDIETGTVNSATNCFRQIISAISSAVNLDENGIKKAEKIKDLGNTLKSYNDSISTVDIEKISASIEAVRNLKDTINDLNNLDAGGIESFQSAIDQLAQTNVQGIVDAFSKVDMSSVGSNLMSTFANGLQSGSGKALAVASVICLSLYSRFMSNVSRFTDIGRQMMNKVAYGITQSRSVPNGAISLALSSAVTTARSYYSRFYNAGGYLCTGMANGITANSYKVKARAAAMASAAATAAENALGIDSPSKVFYRIGKFTGEGFINGLDKYAEVSYASGYTVGTSAARGLNEAINKANSAYMFSVDSEPTIKPVLDLTNIRNGANEINGLFGNFAPNTILGKVGAINKIMSTNSQNGVNDDVVYAIDRLRNKIGDISKPSYSIGDITYSGDSEVSEAITSLIRAIRVERRS